MERRGFLVRGIVQGVGFRPFVHNLAVSLGLRGLVLNQSEGVTIEIQGDPGALDAFDTTLVASPPPLAHITSVTRTSLPVEPDTGFIIRQSEAGAARQAMISPDIATCADCLEEMRNPADRRHQYPFINCTNCGPRYTIILGIPYDRPYTTMAPFVMCPDCRREYEDPSNRRFHAEPICCPVCGPQLVWLDATGAPNPCDDPIIATRNALAAGAIVAIKGIGGYHLACRADSSQAVALLRRRKHRDLKPFAVMARDLETVQKLCFTDSIEEETLQSRARPIVLLRKRPDSRIVDEATPRNPHLGVMLPYTPLHHLLLAGDSTILVMTSANQSHEPIVYREEEAVERLGGLADFFLSHDRGIHIRTDDSVARVISGKPRFLRRSRGYAPFPTGLPFNPGAACALALGAELNSAICVTREDQVFTSHHLGDLDNTPACEGFLQAVAHMRDLMGVTPTLAVADMHPAYFSTRQAMRMGLPLARVQHHHAHIASVLVEHGRLDLVIGVAFDGLGWGDDGALWGGEFLLCGFEKSTRLGRVLPMPLPGGDAAARHPARMALALIRQALDEEKSLHLAESLLPSLAKGERRILSQLVSGGVNTPYTSSAGRLFDAVSALLGVCVENTYHAQAPMELEASAAMASTTAPMPFPIITGEEGLFTLDWRPLIRALVQARTEGAPVEACALGFHQALGDGLVAICREIRDNTGVNTVALSGGVFANRLLMEYAIQHLRQEGFETLMNETLPPGDGGVCVGQAAVALWRTLCA